MQTIKINGYSIEVPEGKAINITNGDVIIDGVIIQSVGNGDLTIADNKYINIECDKNVTVQGNVNGSVKAGGDVNCNNIGGSLHGNNIKCGMVGGSVKADGEVNCGMVGGSVRSGK